jgi:hypothetical protein
MPQLAENSRQGFSTKYPAWTPGPNACNSTVVIGLRAGLVLEGVRKTYRARYYNPTTGRFLSEDPSEFNAGVNFYAYAGDSPTNFIDPYGLDVTVTLWPGDASGAGHVGVGVNTGDTQGWYPIQKYWWCIISDCAMPGNLLNDQAQHPGETPQSITIPTTPQQDQAMRNAMQNWHGSWSLVGRSCARYVEHVLDAGGLNAPDDQTPKNLFNDLVQRQMPSPNPLRNMPPWVLNGPITFLH